jgi:hypothetical protein
MPRDAGSGLLSPGRFLGLNLQTAKADRIEQHVIR